MTVAQAFRSAPFVFLRSITIKVKGGGRVPPYKQYNQDHPLGSSEQ
jgi:hypothetical protein